MSRADRIVERRAWRADCPVTFDRTRKNRSELMKMMGVKLQPGEKFIPPKIIARRISFRDWLAGH